MVDLPTPDHARNMRLLGWSDQGGRPDGVQIMVERGFAYVGHMFSKGFSVVDVRDPRNPRPAGYIAAPPNTWNIHLQVHGDLLLVINAKDMFAEAAFADERAYYRSQVGTVVGTAEATSAARDWTAGLAVYDISTPGAPRRIGFMPVAGGGIHRVWYTGGRWAYVSALLDGFTDYIFMTVDMADPTQPREAGRYWLPGMNRAAGEEKPASFGKRTALHHLISAGNLGYAAWRDGGFTVHDLSDPVNPKLLSHRNYSPPFGGGAHTPLPLPGRDLLVLADEATSSNCANGLAYTWVIDVREPSNPVSIATLPTPTDEDFCAKGAKFGPHNLHENRPGAFRSEDLIFATYHNAGLRVYDIRDAYAPKQVAYFVPPPPERIVDQRPNPARVIQSCDVYVDTNGVMYLSDTNAGLYILQYDGVK